MLRIVHTVGVSIRIAAPLVVLGLLAACAAPVDEPIGSASASPDISVPSLPPTSEPSPTVRLVVESPMPPAESFEDEAAAIIRELTGSQCQVFGGALLIPVDASVHADAVAALPDRTGWLEEPFIWVGSTNRLAAARGGDLVGETDREAWIVFTDPAGEPRAEGYRAFPTPTGDVIWYAEDSIAATPCPQDLQQPQSFEPQPTPAPSTHHLSIDIATFADRWNAAVGDGPYEIAEVVITDSDTERSFVPDLRDWLRVHGRAWPNDRVRSLQVSAEPQLGPNPQSALADTRRVYTSVIRVVDPSLSEDEVDRVVGELHISTLDWHPEDPNPSVQFRSVANGISYRLTGDGFPAWTLHVYRDGDPEADY